jgi:hypothetical protein
MEQEADIFKWLDLRMIASERDKVPGFFISNDASADHSNPVRPKAQGPFQPFPLAFAWSFHKIYLRPPSFILSPIEGKEGREGGNLDPDTPTLALPPWREGWEGVSLTKKGGLALNQNGSGQAHPFFKRFTS